MSEIKERMERLKQLIEIQEELAAVRDQLAGLESLFLAERQRSDDLADALRQIGDQARTDGELYAAQSCRAALDRQEQK